MKVRSQGFVRGEHDIRFLNGSMNFISRCCGVRAALVLVDCQVRHKLARLHRPLMHQAAWQNLPRVSAHITQSMMRGRMEITADVDIVVWTALHATIHTNTYHQRGVGGRFCQRIRSSGSLSYLHFARSAINQSQHLDSLAQAHLVREDATTWKACYTNFLGPQTDLQKQKLICHVQCHEISMSGVFKHLQVAGSYSAVLVATLGSPRPDCGKTNWYTTQNKLCGTIAVGFLFAPTSMLIIQPTDCFWNR